MPLTDDRNDPELNLIDPDNGMQMSYLVLSNEERARGFTRPVRTTYVHTVCGASTTIAQAIAETYARDPTFYGATYCAHCKDHRPIGPAPRGEFVWSSPRDGTPLGTTDNVGT